MAYDEDLADRLRVLLSGQKGVTEQRMFGGLVFLVDGHMSVAASGKGGLMVRLDPAEGDSLVDGEGVSPMEMRGRGMTGFLRVDAKAVDTDERLGEWVARSVGYVRTLPPKKPKAAKAAKRAGGGSAGRR